MSRNKFLIFILFSVCMVVGGVFFAEQKPTKKTSFSKGTTHLHHGFPKQKPNKPLAIEISYTGKELNSGDTFDLTASVFSQVDLGDATYKWVVDQDLEVVSGAVIGHLEGISRGDTETVSLVLRARAKKAMKVFLHVYSDNENSGKIRVGGSGYFNTKNHMRGLASSIKSKPVKKIPVSRIIY